MFGARSQSSSFYYGHDSDFPGRQLWIVNGSSKKATFGHKAHTCDIKDLLYLNLHEQIGVIIRNMRYVKQLMPRPYYDLYIITYTGTLCK